MLAPAAAGARRNRALGADPEGWIELRAPTFTLFTDFGPERAKRFARKLLGFGEAVRRTTNISQTEPHVPLYIFLFRSHEEYVLAGAGIAVTAGFARATPMATFVSLGPASGATETLLHEYTHYLTFNHALDYPSWYLEGFAELLSTYSVRDGLGILGAPPPARVADLADLDDELLPLEEILGEATYPDLKKMRMFYAQSWLLVHYLHTAGSYGRPQRLGQMQRYLEALNQGKDWQAAYEASFDVPLEDLQSELETHRRRITKPGAIVPVVHLDVEEPDTSQLELRRPSAARVAERIGHLWLDGAANGAVAASWFRASLKTRPGRAVVRARLAHALALQQDFEGAQWLIERALARQPESFEVRMREGQVFTLQALAQRQADEPAAAATARARRAFRRATRIAPDAPAGWIGLGRTWLLTDEPPAEGIAALERGLTQITPPPDVEFALAQLLIRAGNTQQARRRLENTLRWSRSDELSKTARRALEALDAPAAVGEAERPDAAEPARAPARPGGP